MPGRRERRLFAIFCDSPTQALALALATSSRSELLGVKRQPCDRASGEVDGDQLRRAVAGLESPGPRNATKLEATRISGSTLAPSLKRISMRAVPRGGGPSRMNTDGASRAMVVSSGSNFRRCSGKGAFAGHPVTAGSNAGIELA
jgi:hypothetical protein